jgi:hypothetical protein
MSNGLRKYIKTKKLVRLGGEGSYSTNVLPPINTSRSPRAIPISQSMRIVQTNNSIDAGPAQTSRPKVEKLHPTTSKNPHGTLGVRAHIEMLNEAQARFKTNEDSDY